MMPAHSFRMVQQKITCGKGGEGGKKEGQGGEKGKREL